MKSGVEGKRKTGMATEKRDTWKEGEKEVEGRMEEVLGGAGFTEDTLVMGVDEEATTEATGIL